MVCSNLKLGTGHNFPIFEKTVGAIAHGILFEIDFNSEINVIGTMIMVA